MSRSVFVISPIGSSGTPEHRRYRQTLEYIVKKAFVGADWSVVRADEETSPDSITTQVIGRIVESDLIVADLTDHNPNVFYELAVAHGFKKPVIHMMQDGQKVPFDVVDQRVIFYDLTDPESLYKAQAGLINAAKWLDDNPNQSRNPLSAYNQFSAISSASGGGEAGAAVAEALGTLSRQVARLDARVRDLDEPDSPFNERMNELGAREMALRRQIQELESIDELDESMSKHLSDLKRRQRMTWAKIEDLRARRRSSGPL